MLIRVIKWTDHQGRRDYVAPTWFKLHHRLMLSAEYLSLGKDELIAWLYILSLCNEANQSSITVIWSHHQVFGRMSKEQFVSAVQTLRNLRWIHVSEDDLGAICTESDRDPNGIRERSERNPHGRIREELEKKRNTSTPASIDSPSREIVNAPQGELVYDADHESASAPAEPDAPPPLPNLAKLWNEHAPKVLARVLKAEGSRLKNARARWREHPKPEFWLELFKRIEKSNFLMGRIPGKEWRIDFDFLVRSGIVTRILEGQYDNRGWSSASSDPGKKSAYVQQLEREEAERKGGGK